LADWSQRFAICEPGIDTTSIDTAAIALETRAYYLRRVGEGFQVRHQATLRKIVNDEKAALDDKQDVTPAMRKLVETEFERGRSVPWLPFPADGTAVADDPKLRLVVLDPLTPWEPSGGIRAKLGDWTRQRGTSPRLFPGGLVWCLCKPGREFRTRVETWLAWQRVKKEIDSGRMASDRLDEEDRRNLVAEVRAAEQTAREEVWASYRFVVIADARKPDGLDIIDLGVGHSSANMTLSGRVIEALKSKPVLSESVGASYIERNWPPALKAAGA